VALVSPGQTALRANGITSDVNGQRNARRECKRIDTSFLQKPFGCHICGLRLSSLHSLGAHLKGKSHAKALLKANLDASQLHCQPCGLTVNSLAQMQSHQSGSKHKANIGEQPMVQRKRNDGSTRIDWDNLPNSLIPSGSGGYKCKACNKVLNSKLQTVEVDKANIKDLVILEFLAFIVKEASRARVSFGVRGRPLRLAYRPTRARAAHLRADGLRRARAGAVQAALARQRARITVLEGRPVSAGRLGQAARILIRQAEEGRVHIEHC